MPWKDDRVGDKRDVKAGGKEHFEWVAIVPSGVGR